MTQTVRHVALLRGINVGKGKRVEMPRLVRAFEDLGFSGVKTLLNSGNVLFDAPATGSPIPAIERKLRETFGFEIPVLVRRQDEIRALVESDPFRSADPTAKCFVTFTGPTSGEVCTAIPADAQTTEMMADLQKRHGPAITTRNWNTVVKLAS